MKAEHRKELETNALASGMGRMIRGMRERPKRRSVLVWVLALVVLVGLGAWYWFWAAGKQTASDNWAMVDLATRPEVFLGMGFDTRSGESQEPVKTPVGRVARFEFAWLALYDYGIKKLA